MLHSKAYKNSYPTLTNKGLAAIVLPSVVAAAVLIAAAVSVAVILVLPTTPEDCHCGTMLGTYTRPLLVCLYNHQ